MADEVRDGFIALKTAGHSFHANRRRMPMAISALTYSGALAASRNPTLHDLIARIRAYNLLLPTLLNQKRANANYLLDRKAVVELDLICAAIWVYLLHKPKGVRKATGKAKWDDVIAVKVQAEEHADFFGVKFLEADFSGKEGGFNYWLERAAPGNASDQLYDDFVFWLSGNMGKGQFTSTSTSSSQVLQYFDAQRRARYEVRAEGKVLMQADQPLDTSGGIGTYTGLKNTWIYVCSATSRKVYSYKSTANFIHHSSFLSGEPVIAAGDWVVIDGGMNYLNSGSGHYRPSDVNMRSFMNLNASWWEGEAVVQPNYKGKIMRVRDYQLRGLKAPMIKPDMLDRVAGMLGVTDLADFTKNAKLDDETAGL